MSGEAPRSRRDIGRGEREARAGRAFDVELGADLGRHHAHELHAEAVALAWSAGSPTPSSATTTRNSPSMHSRST